MHSVGHCSRCKHHRRAAAVAAVVRQGRPAGQGGRRRGPRRPGRRSTRPSWRSATSTGSTTCTTGASRASCGGATASRSGTGRTARSSASARTTQPPTGEGWTPGHRRPRHLVLLRRCGRSPRSAGRTRPPDLRRFYPTSVLVTGYDILFFWVARMMMFGLYAMDGSPAVRRRRAARHGPRPVRQEDVEVVRQRRRPAGLDGRVRRPTRCASPSPAAPTPAPTCRSARSGCRARRNFCNKLWNATRFALMNGADGRGRRCRRPSELSAADRWILSRLQHGRRRGRRATTSDYEFAKVCDALYHFAWDEVFDWYVELAKTPLAAGGEAGRAHPAGCSATCWTPCCGCCTRSSRSSPRRCGRR